MICRVWRIPLGTWKTRTMDTEDALLDVEDTPEGLEGLEDIPGTEEHALGGREQWGVKAVPR